MDGANTVFHWPRPVDTGRTASGFRQAWVKDLFHSQTVPLPEDCLQRFNELFRTHIIFREIFSLLIEAVYEQLSQAQISSFSLLILRHQRPTEAVFAYNHLRLHRMLGSDYSRYLSRLSDYLHIEIAAKVMAILNEAGALTINNVKLVPKSPYRLHRIIKGIKRLEHNGLLNDSWKDFRIKTVLCHQKPSSMANVLVLFNKTLPALETQSNIELIARSYDCSLFKSPYGPSIDWAY